MQHIGDLAVVAELIDTRGQMTIRRIDRRNRGKLSPEYRALVRLSTDEDIAPLLQRTYGGSITSMAGRHHRVFRYEVSDRQAAALLSAILPFMDEQREIAAALLQLRTLREHSVQWRTSYTGASRPHPRWGGHAVRNIMQSPAYLDACEALRLHVVALNQRRRAQMRT